MSLDPLSPQPPSLQPLDLHPPRLHTLRQDGPLWRAHGDTDTLELSCAAPGVLRLRLAAGARAAHMNFPRLPAKQSLMLAPGQPGALALVQVEAQAGEWRLTGGGLCVTVQQSGGRVKVQELHDDGTPGRALAELEAWGTGTDPLRRRTASLAAPALHSYLGFGQKVGPLDKRGMHLTFWNTDCFPHHLDTDPMHLSVPFTTVLTPQGQAHGLFLDETWRTEIDVAKRNPARLGLISAGQELDLYVLAGPTIPGVLRRYADLTGHAPLPPLRPLALHYPHDAQARAEVSSYLLGEGLLVAPVLAANTVQRPVYLPGAGESWAEVFNLSSFGEVHAGGQTVTAQAALDTLPLYLKSGQAIPTTEAALHTTHARWERLSWLAHAGPQGLSGTLYEDDGDGHGPHRLTRLWAERGAGRFVLGREEVGELERVRRSEQLHLTGLESVDEVQGARSWHFDGGLLRVTLPEGWTEISILGD